MTRILAKPRRKNKKGAKPLSAGPREVKLALRGKPNTIQNDEGFFRP